MMRFNEWDNGWSSINSLLVDYRSSINGNVDKRDFICENLNFMMKNV